MLTHCLTKTSAKGGVYWQIAQDGSLTYIEHGQLDGKGRREFPAIEHGTDHEAHTYVERQLQQKRRQGYKKGGQSFLKRTSEFQEDYTDEPHRKKNRPLPQHYDREFDYEDNTGPGSNVALQQKVRRLERKTNRTMEEEVLLANARADAVRLGVPMDIYDDGDTDSVASSASSYSTAPRRRGAGVSPLNKRRSVRLALKRGSTAEMTRDMRQNSVTMATPPHLARMNTQQRWASWRPKRQATSTMLKGAASIVDMDTLSPRTIVRKPALMKRASTTTFLRQALQGTAIKEEILVPKVFDTDNSAEDAATSSPANHLVPPNNLRKSMRRLGTRTSVQIMPSLVEGDTTDGGNESSPRLSVPVMKGATSNTAPRMRRAPTRPRLLKRSSTTEVAEVEPSTKRTKRASLSRCQSISAVRRQITLPTRDTWPVHIVAQVVWRVPLTIPGLAGRGRAVCVQTDRCLVAEDSGKVFAIDETVSVKHVTQLPAGLTHINQDGQFVYGVCSNGQVYDISQADPRLVFELKTKGKEFCLDAFDGVLLVCDSQGHVTRYDHNGEVVWKTRNSVGQGFMVCAGDEGVLCCSSVGVTSLSLRDGTMLWETPLRDSALHAVKKDELLYVACGPNVLRLDTTTGEINKTYKYPKRGKGAAPNLSCVAVGGGLVFACGRNIICFEERSGDIVFVLEPPLTPCRAAQYFEGRLFYVGDECMSVVDFSPEVIARAKGGHNLEPVDIGPKLQSPVQTPLQRLPTVIASQPSSPGVEVECFRPEPRKSRLKVRAISQGYSGELDVQFPSVSSYLPGTKFVVHDLKRSETGGFYRVLGDIKQVTDS